MAEEHPLELERIKKAEEEKLNTESEEAGEKS
jgi:hypothetical protein